MYVIYIYISHHFISHIHISHTYHIYIYVIYVYVYINKEKEKKRAMMKKEVVVSGRSGQPLFFQSACSFNKITCVKKYFLINSIFLFVRTI